MTPMPPLLLTATLDSFDLSPPPLLVLPTEQALVCCWQRGRIVFCGKTGGEEMCFTGTKFASLVRATNNFTQRYIIHRY
jgi:hypothetical protein